MSNDDYGECLAVPPLDTTFLDDDVFLLDPDVDFDFDFDFDFSIDHLLHDSFEPAPDSSSPDNLVCHKDSTQTQTGSPNCGSNKPVNSITSSNHSDNSLSRNGVVDQVVGLDLEGCVKDEGGNGNGLLKRKKEDSDGGVDGNCNSKYRKSSVPEEEKMKVRLMRNRESAHLSRQRKKHYVQELEGKVRSMNSTIQELNAKIAYIVAENASLKQQMGGVGPGMGMGMGVPSMMYSWMPAFPYVVNPRGSQVPLLPIPRVKPQQMAAAPKASRKTESKKSHGRTKKVASVSFLGLLFFMLLFGGLVPMVNVRYGGTKDLFMGRSNILGDGHYEQHRGRVLAVDGEEIRKGADTNSKFSCGRRDHSEGELSTKHGGCGFVGEGNGSEPLMASLYVPRNDKLVKIDGNLIIHSILASEKATKPSEDHQEKTNDETGLALLRDLVPSDPRRNAGRHPHLALGSGGERKTVTADHQLHQWFREGLAGPMLSSGKCTEVFQFDVIPASAPGAIISATSARNVSTASSKNSTHVNKGRNRRILHGLPIPLPGSSAPNVSEEGIGRDAGNGKYPGTNSSSSMVVSVLLDPREAADAEVDGVMRVKSLSRIFVVVLIDGVKYVTYSCMFPFKGAAVPHLVTA